MPQPAGEQIFISHASVDKPFVRKLARAIENEGFNAWLDESELLPGDDLPGAISAALEQAAVFIVVLSENSVTSNWLMYELRIATLRMIRKELVVIPVCIDQTQPPAEIKSLVWADFTDGFESGWRVVQAALRRALPDQFEPDGSGKPEHLRSENTLLNARSAQAERLRLVLSEQVPDVLRATRVLEARTGFVSSLARAQLVDCFAHIAALVERSEFSPDRQDLEFQNVEEHLRRAMSDGGEQVVLSQVADLKERWDEYQRKAFHRRERGVLDGVATHAELEQLRAQIARRVDDVRTRKLSSDWEDARYAAASLHETAALCEELNSKLEQCIGRAESFDRDSSASLTSRILRNLRQFRWARVAGR